MNWSKEDCPEQEIHLWTLQDEIKTEYSSLSIWTLQDEIKTEFNFESGYPYIYLLSEDMSNLLGISQFDLKQVEYIKSNIDLFFTKGIEYLKNELKNNPDVFGIDKNKVSEYSSLSNDEFPVDFPELTFYPNKKWLMRFADADFPVINYGHGIAVDFDEDNEPESFYILPEE